jgi:hypothetical protein
MSVSAWGLARDDTIDLIRAIVPTVYPGVLWQHLGADVDERAVGAESREYTTREVSLADPGEVAIGGAGQRQERYALQLRIVYRMTEYVDDMIGGDHVDLINALQPSSTYASGTWGSLRLRKVTDFIRDDDTEEGVVVVRQTVEHMVRFPVTI